MASEDAGDHIAIARRRLRWRAWHRGTRELDLLLGRFTDAHIDAMPAAELGRLEALFACEDTDLRDWLMGETKPPPSTDEDLLRRVKAFGMGFSR